MRDKMPDKRPGMAPGKMPGGRILVVEDDRELAEGIAWMLEKEGFIPLVARSLSEAGRLHRGEGADLVLLDVNLPVSGGERGRPEQDPGPLPHGPGPGGGHAEGL